MLIHPLTFASIAKPRPSWIVHLAVMVLERGAVEHARRAGRVFEEERVAHRGSVRVRELERDAGGDVRSDEIEAHRAAQGADVAGVRARVRVPDRHPEDGEGDAIVQAALEVSARLEIDVVDDARLAVAEPGGKIRAITDEEARAELRVAVPLVLRPRARLRARRREREDHHERDGVCKSHASPEPSSRRPPFCANRTPARNLSNDFT